MQTHDMNVAGFKLLADVDLAKTSHDHCMYNTSIYEVTWDMPYFLAMNTNETFPMNRNRAAADLAVVSPALMDGALAVALDAKVDYLNASRNDAIVSSYNSFGYELSPSFTYRIDARNTVGLSVRVKNQPAKNVITTGDGRAIEVAFLRPLGSYLMRWAGGSTGLGLLEYSSATKGVSLQYNNTGAKADWLLELSLDKTASGVSEKNDNMVKGAVDKFVTGASVQGLFGENRSRKLDVDVKYNLFYCSSSTGGTAVSQNNMIDAKLNYSVYTGAGKDHTYDYVFGLGMDVFSLDCERANPVSTLTTLSLLPHAFLGKNIRLSQSGFLLVRMDAGYRFASNTRFNYGGTASATDRIVNGMYDDELGYLKSYYYSLDGDVSYTHKLTGALSVYARARANYIKPMTISGDRAAAEFSVGVMF